MSEGTCGIRAPQVGSAAPAFSGSSVVGTQFADLKFEGGVLSVGGESFKGKWTVLFFYPLDFTFVCPTEIIAFHEHLPSFEKLNTKVVGASIDSQFTHLAWKKTPRKDGGLGEIGFPLLADVTKNASRDYGVLLPGGVAARGVFIIDDKGILQSCTVNNLGVGRNVEEILRTLEGYQFVAKHGEVCPANWKPGAATMKPDPEGSKDYFKTVK
ncbi:MAG: peroxiredoxin [Planctomycetes bacterium]|nr:peroxiredoxin [Planctomycetota bacterium]